MGVFDELRVEYPLPDGFDPAGRLFQTQDTPLQWLGSYVLRADGALIDAHTGERVFHHGTLTFYTDNVAAHGPQGYITTDREPAWWAEYTALYHHGTLITIEGQKAPNTTIRGPHLARAEWHARNRARGKAGQP